MGPFMTRTLLLRSSAVAPLRNIRSDATVGLHVTFSILGQKTRQTLLPAFSGFLLTTEAIRILIGLVGVEEDHGIDWERSHIVDTAARSRAGITARARGPTFADDSLGLAARAQ